MKKLSVILLISSCSYLQASDQTTSEKISPQPPVQAPSHPNNNDSDASDYEDGEEAVKGNPRAFRPKSPKPCNHSNCFPITIGTLFNTGSPTIACLTKPEKSDAK